MLLPTGNYMVVVVLTESATDTVCLAAQLSVRL